MTFGGSQDVSASGGCPPYNWSLSGGGTLTPIDDTRATYVAPSSNPSCTNKPMITLTDNCRNMADIQIAVNCCTGPEVAYKYDDADQYTCSYNGNICIWTGFGGCNYYACNSTLLYDGMVPINTMVQVDPNCSTWTDGRAECDAACAEGPMIRCASGFCGGFGWGYHDWRSTPMKTAGCCPINPETGLPFDALAGTQERGKNAGRPDLCDNSVGKPTNAVGNPVNVATGNKYEEAIDISISTPGIPLEFRRSYNSQLILNGPLGYGWTHNYDMILSVVQTSPTKRVRIWDSDGRALYFAESGGVYTGESGVIDKLEQVNPPSGDYFLRRKEGNLTYKFNSSGRLLQISDPNGNTLTLGYDGSNRLSQVSNNFGKAITIGYYPGQNRIQTATDPNGKSVSYEYLNGDLAKVTYPDHPADNPTVFSSVSYVYNNHLLIEKRDTNNNLIGFWDYDRYDDKGKVKTYYSHLAGNPLQPQEMIELTYAPGQTVMKRTIDGTPYTTTYFTRVIDGIHVVEKIQGCSTCGSEEKEFAYTPGRLELFQVTSIDNGIRYTTQYNHDDQNHPWEITGITEGITNPSSPEQRTTGYTYTHRTDHPFILNQRTETKLSVVQNCPQNNVITITYDPNGKGNMESRAESGCVLIDGAPAQRTYTTSYQYNAFGQVTQINGPRTDLSDITTFEYYESGVPEVNNRYQLKAIVNALNQRTEFSEYDANGNVGKIKDSNNVETQYTYDERNRIRTVTNLSTTAQTQYFYDARGNLDYVH